MLGVQATDSGALLKQQIEILKYQDAIAKEKLKNQRLQVSSELKREYLDNKEQLRSQTVSYSTLRQIQQYAHDNGNIEVKNNQTLLQIDKLKKATQTKNEQLRLLEREYEIESSIQDGTDDHRVQLLKAQLKEQEIRLEEVQNVNFQYQKMVKSFPDQKDYSHELDVQRELLDKITKDLKQQSEALAEIKEACAQKRAEYAQAEQDIRDRQAEWKASINQKRAELKKMHSEPPVPEPSMFVVTEEMEQLDKPSIQREDFVVRNVFERYLIDPEKFLASMKALTEQKKINDEVVEKLHQRRTAILKLITGLKSQMAETESSVQPFQHTGVLEDSVVAKKVSL